MQTKEERASRRRAHYVENRDRLKRKQNTYYNTVTKKKRRRDPVGCMWANARDRARDHGLDFNINRDDIVMPAVCPVFGVPFDLESRRNIPNAPTLDRTDPQKGYVKGNVEVISYRANRLKSNATPDELEAIARYMRSAQERLAA